MTITPPLFAAHLKCTTKCWLRAVGENPTGNAYAEWIQDQNESYRADGLKRLLSVVSQHECAIAPAAGEVKTAKWRLALDVPVRTEEFPSSEPRSSRREEALPEKSEIRNPKSEIEISLTTSAATTNEDEPQSKWTTESRLHAVERLPSEGRGKPAQFIPVRFVLTNKLGKHDKLLLAFDALALSKLLGREVGLGKIIHGDDHSTLKVKTSALTGEVRKRLEKITALLSSPVSPDLVLNRHCAECEFQPRCRQKAVEKDDLSLLSGMSAKERQRLNSNGIFTVTQLSYTFRPRRRPKRQRDKREKYQHSLKALAIRERKIHVVGSLELKIEGTPVYLDVEGLPDRDFYYLIGVRIGNGESVVQHSLWADTVEDEGKIWREFLGILETVEKPMLIHYGGFESTFMRRMRQQYGEPPQGSSGHSAIEGAANLVSVIFGQFYFPTHSNGLKHVAKFLGFQWSDPMASGTRSIVVHSGWEQSRESTAKEWLLRYNANDCQALELVASSLLRICGHARVNESNISDMVNVESLKPQWPFSFGKKESVTPDLEFLRKAAYWDYQRDRLYFRPSGRRRPKSRNALAGCNTTSMRINKVVVHDVSPECPTCKRISTKPKATRVRILYDLCFGHFSVKRWVVKHMFQTYFCSRCERFFGLEKRFRKPLKFGWNLVAYFVYQTVQLYIPQRIVTLSMNQLYGLGLKCTTTHRLKTRAAVFYEETQREILARLVEGDLLHADETNVRPMVETVDRRGLKRHFLRKHRKGVDRFFRDLGKASYHSEAALKCKDRFEKNRQKLFTFLDYDGIPWNNNNAEHAIKAFAALRNVMEGTSTRAGLEAYLTLLSICQTCTYMGVDFLDFLRSGEKDIHAFAESRRRRRAQTGPPTGLSVGRRLERGVGMRATRILRDLLWCLERSDRAQDESRHGSSGS